MGMNSEMLFTLQGIQQAISGCVGIAPADGGKYRADFANGTSRMATQAEMDAGAALAATMATKKAAQLQAAIQALADFQEMQGVIDAGPLTTLLSLPTMQSQVKKAALALQHLIRGTLGE
jgi:hypothetical protein